MNHISMNHVYFIIAVLSYLAVLFKVVIPYSFNFLGFVPSVIITLLTVGLPIIYLHRQKIKNS